MKQRFSTRTRLVSALLTLAMVFTFLPFSAFAEEELTDGYGIIELAEYILPDKAFREYLKKFDTNNDGKLAPAERYAVKEIDVASKNISNLFGIQFFPNLRKLVCYSNKLTELDVSKNTVLEYLDCANNQLTGLDVRQNAALQTLDCSQNQLTSLDVRQNTKLDVVWCYQNQLTELDVRQNAALEYLYCQENQLTELDVRKNIALQNLACYSNALTSLDVSKNTQLQKLYCYSNQLTSLDVSRNPALWLLSCGINQLTELDVSQNPALKYLYCSDNQLTELDVSRNNKISELEANNNYLTNLNVDNTSIDIDNSGSVFAAKSNTYPITVGSDRTFDLSTLPGTFDVTKATRWNGGTVRGNTLTVNAGATKVTYLYDCGKRSSYTFTLNVTVGIRIFGDNFPNYEFRQYLKANIDKDGDGYLNDTELNIRKLDVSGQHIANLKGIEFFPNLEILYCYNNKLTSLDVSKNPALQYLYCSNNNLTSLDVSKNTNLTELECNENQLTELDVRQNAALTYLSCSKNNLTSLDVSKNTNLIELECNENQLTSLDVSKNTVLEYLWCSQNNLTSLDVSKNTALKKLYFSKNQLTKLDVRQNAALTKLVCDQNQLTELDVSQNAALVDLYCYQNQLTELDVSKNTALDWLKCYQNQLTSLDVSQNKALELLYCQQNYLTSLDVSKNTQLRALRCSQNNLTSLNVENTKVDLPAIYLPEFEAENNTYLIAVGSDRTFDLSNLPGFDVTKASGWVGGTVDGGTLKVDESATQVTYTYDCGKGFSKTFTLNVNVVPDGTVTPPSGGGTGTTTPPSGGGTGTTTPPSGGDGTGTVTPPSGGDGTGTVTPPSGGSTGGDGGGAAIIMVAGAAVAGVVGYGVYNYVSGQKLQALLPEGVAAPENRAQTALLLWNTAGRPEPAEAPAFADVADPDTAKAAQWCVEQGLMKRRLNGKFAPDSNIPAYQVLNAYRKLAGG